MVAIATSSQSGSILLESSRPVELAAECQNCKVEAGFGVRPKDHTAISAKPVTITAAINHQGERNAIAMLFTR